jgi:hypothetical protein
MFDCSISSCFPHIIFTIIVIIGGSLVLYLLLYIYLMWDTYMYHSNDLKSWKDQQLQLIYDQPNA